MAPLVETSAAVSQLPISPYGYTAFPRLERRRHSARTRTASLTPETRGCLKNWLAEGPPPAENRVPVPHYVFVTVVGGIARRAGDPGAARRTPPLARPREEPLPHVR